MMIVVLFLSCVIHIKTKSETFAASVVFALFHDIFLTYTQNEVLISSPWIDVVYLWFMQQSPQNDEGINEIFSHLSITTFFPFPSLFVFLCSDMESLNERTKTTVLIM